jgi:hypothetical protein
MTVYVFKEDDDEDSLFVKLSFLCHHKKLVFRTVRETFTSHGSPHIVLIGATDFIAA